MRNIWSISKREILSFFVSPVAYFVITGFVVLAGYFFFNMLGIFNLALQRFSAMPYRTGLDAPNLNQWVVEGFYSTLVVVLVFLIPLLTMRLIADERKNGTFELLVTSPVKVREIVLGKFIGVSFVILLMVLLAFFFPLILCVFGNPEVLPILSGALGVLLCAVGFASIGMAVSSFTENQVVAAVCSMVTLLLFYVIGSPAESIGGVAGEILTYLSPVVQVQNLIKGVISLKTLVYFGSLVGLGLFLSERALEAYRWR